MKVYNLSDFLIKSQNYFYLSAKIIKDRLRDEIYFCKRKGYLGYTSVKIEISHTLFGNISKKLKKYSIGHGYYSI